VFWVISVYFNIRNTLPKFCPFLLGHPVYCWILKELCTKLVFWKVYTFLSLMFHSTGFISEIHTEDAPLFFPPEGSSSSYKEVSTNPQKVTKSHSTDPILANLQFWQDNWVFKGTWQQTDASGVRIPVKARHFCLVRNVQISSRSTQPPILCVSGYFSGGKTVGEWGCRI